MSDKNEQLRRKLEREKRQIVKELTTARAEWPQERQAELLGRQKRQAKSLIGKIDAARTAGNQGAERAAWAQFDKLERNAQQTAANIEANKNHIAKLEEQLARIEQRLQWL